MAKFFKTTRGYGLRRTAAEEKLNPLPADATEVIEFDESANAEIIESLSGKSPPYIWQDHSIKDGSILRAGEPMTVLPSKADKASASFLALAEADKQKLRDAVIDKMVVDAILRDASFAVSHGVALGEVDAGKLRMKKT